MPTIRRSIREHFSQGDAETAATRLTACLIDTEAWLKASRLLLNPTKTQVMWLGSPQQLAKPPKAMS